MCEYTVYKLKGQSHCYSVKCRSMTCLSQIQKQEVFDSIAVFQVNICAEVRQKI